LPIIHFPKKWVELLAELQLAPSKSEARRLIQQGAVELNSKKMTDPNEEVKIEPGTYYDLKVGKKIRLRIIRKRG
jgi:tyrosyl-tRNA synthetase